MCDYLAYKFGGFIRCCKIEKFKKLGGFIRTQKLLLIIINQVFLCYHVFLRVNYVFNPYSLYYILIRFLTF